MNKFSAPHGTSQSVTQAPTLPRSRTIPRRIRLTHRRHIPPTHTWAWSQHCYCWESYFPFHIYNNEIYHKQITLPSI